MSGAAKPARLTLHRAGRIDRQTLQEELFITMFVASIGKPRAATASPEAATAQGPHKCKPRQRCWLLAGAIEVCVRLLRDGQQPGPIQARLELQTLAD
jgi:hypothetical protein